MHDPRKGTKENYYNSDLNRFVAENCRKDMTAIDIDLVLYSWKDKRIMFIESKHTKERLGRGQFILLKLLARLCKVITKVKIDYFLVRGDSPYIDVQIIDLFDQSKYVLKGNQCKKFLNFDLLLNNGNIKEIRK